MRTPQQKKTDPAAYTGSWKGMRFLAQQIIVAKDFEDKSLCSVKSEINLFLWYLNVLM